MKKILAMILALTLLVLAAVPVLAVSWLAPAMSVGVSPFKAEVIKLQVHSDVAGGEYYTVLPDAAAYGYGRIYYAIRLTVPSYADANAYYGTKDLVPGSKIKVTIEYENILGKSRDATHVELAGEAQTLWYDGVDFSPGWTQALERYAKNKHILSGTAADTETASIRVCIASKNTLADILIDDCYTIQKKEFYGVRTCVNCKPENLSGYLVSGDCGRMAVFVSINKNSIANGVYVIDKTEPQASYEGATVKVDKTLYRWEIVGQGEYCDYHACRHMEYGLRELQAGTVYSRAGRLASAAQSDGTFAEYCERNKLRPEVRDFGAVYYMDEEGLYQPVSATSSWWPAAGFCHKDGTAYADDTALRYHDVYYTVAAYTDVLLHKMLSAKSVDCDTTDGAFLHAANYVMGKLGFTYAEVLAGTVHMTEANVLSNFGFAVDDCTTVTWGAYTALITVTPSIPVAQVPDTGDAPWWARLLKRLGVWE